MGLGKTLQALCGACHYRNEWPLLIVAPSLMKYAWAEEIEKWLADICPNDLHIIQSCLDIGCVDASYSV